MKLTPPREGFFNMLNLNHMFWADEFAETIIKSGKYKPYHVDDMKTPSGKIHVGALRGVVVHDLIHQALLTKGVKSVYTYVFNDMDPMDAFPHYLPEKFQQYMGWPLYKIPSPEPGFESLAACYAMEFEKIFNGLGIKPKIIWSHEEYGAGKFDATIKTVLDKVELIRKLYHDISGYDKPKNWFPYQVFCPKCSKVGTTIVTGWDGKKVSFTCQKDLVKWAEGCGYQGEIEPVKENGKLMWKVDWAAHWQVIGVTAEGAGKDHMSQGGSHDLSSAICEQVLNYPTPFKFIYEWFLAKSGTKMSSSKGVGISAAEVSQTLPPELLKFLLVKTPYRRAIIFDPSNNDSILKLFDDYDQAMANKDIAWKLSQVKPGAKPIKNPPRFRDVVNYMQNPKIDLNQQFARADKAELTKRIKYAKIWIDKYAPPMQVFQITKEIPEFAGTFTDTQRAILTKAHNIAVDAKSPEEIQQKVYEEAKTIGLSPSNAFGTIYQATIGKDHGPKAGWLLFNNPQAINRLAEAAIYVAKKTKVQYLFPEMADSRWLKVSQAIKDKYSSVILGVAVLEDINVAKQHPGLEAEKQALVTQLEKMSIDELNNSPEIQSYRRLYREMGVDWGKRKSSPVALVRRVIKGQGLYTINTCVDSYNQVVMKYRVSAGAFDLDQMKFPATLDIAKGGEKAVYIGDKEPTEIRAGEICYFDKIGPYNLDFNYRDSVRTAVTESTKNIIINVDGIYDITREQVERTLKEVIDTIIKYCGGRLKTAGIVLAE